MAPVRERGDSRQIDYFDRNGQQVRKSLYGYLCKKDRAVSDPAFCYTDLGWNRFNRRVRTQIACATTIW